MNPPARLLVRWRALSELKSHVDLLGWLGENLPAEILILSASPVPGGETNSRIRVESIRESWKIHPATRLLRGWKGAAEVFDPDVVLALDEAYCLSTYQLVRWAHSRMKPALFLSCQNIDRPLPMPFKRIESSVLKTASGGWFLNDDALDRAKARGFADVGQVIPLPINPKDYPLIGESAPEPVFSQPFQVTTPLTIGYAGRLVPEKGLETLILACDQTRDRLLIVGEGPERQRLEDLAAGTGIESEWLGSIPSDQMPEVYSKMDVLVLPSLETPRWKEQFGRVLVEAMASGVPVVGSRSGEIPKVIGEAGLLFDPGNTQSLANQLKSLKETPDLYEKLRDHGIARVRALYTIERVGSQICRLLNESGISLIGGYT